MVANIARTDLETLTYYYLISQKTNSRLQIDSIFAYKHNMTCSSYIKVPFLDNFWAIIVHDMINVKILAGLKLGDNLQWKSNLDTNRRNFCKVILQCAKDFLHFARNWIFDKVDLWDIIFLSPHVYNIYSFYTANFNFTKMAVTALTQLRTSNQFYNRGANFGQCTK